MYSEDLQYCSPQEMDTDARKEMDINLADRKKLKRAMEILNEEKEEEDIINNKSQAITLMGFINNSKSRMNMNKKEGVITLMGQTNQMIEYKKYDEDLYIGNIHKLCKKQHIYYSDEKQAHDWTIFITKSKNKLIEPQSIKQVTYYLHKTFHPSIITVKDAPFSLEKRGWGFFVVDAKIEFLDEYNKNDLYCSHLLDFKHKVTVTHIDKHNSQEIKRENHDNNNLPKDWKSYNINNAAVYHCDNFANFVFVKE